VCVCVCVCVCVSIYLFIHDAWKKNNKSLYCSIHLPRCFIPNNYSFTPSASLSSDIDSHTGDVQECVGTVQCLSLTTHDDQEPDHLLTDHKVYICW